MLVDPNYSHNGRQQRNEYTYQINLIELVTFGGENKWEL